MNGARLDEERGIRIQPHDPVAVLNLDPWPVGAREHLEMKRTTRLSSVERDIPMRRLQKRGHLRIPLPAMGRRNSGQKEQEDYSRKD